MRGPGATDAVLVTCYAESRDGINWVRPEMGLFEAAGSRRNNIILVGNDMPSNFTPLLDNRPGVDPAERFKALPGTHETGLVAYVSPDGIHWKKMREDPVLPASKIVKYDSQNVAFWWEHEKRYVCYFRTFRRFDKRFVRWVSRTASSDFVN